MTAQVWISTKDMIKQTEQFRLVVAEYRDEMQSVAMEASEASNRLRRLEHPYLALRYHISDYSYMWRSPLVSRCYDIEALFMLAGQSDDGRMLIGDAERALIDACSNDPTEECKTFIDNRRTQISGYLEKIEKLLEPPAPETPLVMPPRDVIIKPDGSEAEPFPMLAILGPLAIVLLGALVIFSQIARH